MLRKIFGCVLALMLCVGAGLVTASAADGDFVIENGVLTEYKGNGGAVAIPSGVTSIGDSAFEGSDITAATPLAYASTQNVEIDGNYVSFQMYALRDANGNDTNYIKVRDLASVLSSTPAKFDVSWDGAVNLISGKAYQATGDEMRTPFSGNRTYTVPQSMTKVNGTPTALDAIVLTDDAGGDYTYYKLRDLGNALGFHVDWSAERGVFIQTN